MLLLSSLRNRGKCHKYADWIIYVFIFLIFRLVRTTMTCAMRARARLQTIVVYRIRFSVTQTAVFLCERDRSSDTFGELCGAMRLWLPVVRGLWRVRRCPEEVALRALRLCG